MDFSQEDIIKIIGAKELEIISLRIALTKAEQHIKELTKEESK